MKLEDIKKVGIVGSGTMGPGIAGVFLQYGYTTIVKEVNAELAEKANEKISGILQSLVKRGKISQEDAQTKMANLRTVTAFEELKECDFVIDATPDSTEIKNEVFRTVSNLVKDEAVIATTSSLMSITDLAAVAKHPEAVIGMHFCIPAHLMSLVEVAKAQQTSDETVFIANSLCKALGKVAVVCNDTPGFIVNYLLFPLISRAIKLVDSGMKVKDVDQAMKLGLGHAMGPLELADMSGLDSCLAAMNTLYSQLYDEAYAPPVLLQKMVAAGYLGRKSKKGFYEY